MPSYEQATRWAFSRLSLGEDSRPDQGRIVAERWGRLRLSGAGSFLDFDLSMEIWPTQG